MRAFGTAVEVIGAKILVRGSVLEHMVDGGEDRGGDGADRFLRPAPSEQAAELSLQIASLLVLGRLRALDERGLEPLGALAQAGGSPFARALIVAWRQSGPRDEMTHSGESAHIEADLGDDDFRAERAHARDGAHEFDGSAKGREVGVHLAVHRSDRAIKVIDLSQMKLEQEAVMRRNAATQRLLKLALRGLHVVMRQCRQPHWIALACDHRLKHRSAALTKDIREFGVDLDVGIFQRLLDALGVPRAFANQLLARAQQSPQLLRLT